MTEPVRRIVTGDTVGPVDATAVPRYGGAATFARLPRLDEVAHADGLAAWRVPGLTGANPGALLRIICSRYSGWRRALEAAGRERVRHDHGLQEEGS